MARGSKLITTFSPAARGWARYSLKPWAESSVPPSRIYFSSVPPPETPASPMRTSPCGAITGSAFATMKDAPLIETRVCQYEQTSDSHFVVDRHPRMNNVWLLGGGSGHGLKHGPALGEMMADLILKDGQPSAVWRLSRFSTQQQK